MKLKGRAGRWKVINGERDTYNWRERERDRQRQIDREASTHGKTYRGT